MFVICQLSAPLRQSVAHLQDPIFINQRQTMFVPEDITDQFIQPVQKEWQLIEFVL